MLVLCWLKNLALRVKNGKHIDVKPMPRPDFSLKKRKLEDALSAISASSVDLAKKRRACEEPLQQMKDSLAALPVFVFTCNI